MKHIDVKGCNNRIESDHAAVKRIINPGKGFQSLRTAKATLSAVEAFRTIKRGDVFVHTLNSGTEIELTNEMFGLEG